MPKDKIARASSILINEGPLSLSYKSINYARNTIQYKSRRVTQQVKYGKATPEPYKILWVNPKNRIHVGTKVPTKNI